MRLELERELKVLCGPNGAAPLIVRLRRPALTNLVRLLEYTRVLRLFRVLLRLNLLTLSRPGTAMQVLLGMCPVT